MANGRPTKYKNEFTKVAEDYVAECKRDKKVPWIEEIAARLGVSEMTIWRWSKANKDFCYAVDNIKNHQKLALKTIGLSKNPTQMAIFLLKANHDLYDKHEVKHTSDGDKPIRIVFSDPFALPRN